MSNTSIFRAHSLPQAADPDRWYKPAPMTQGNMDMVNRLCAGLSELRAKWGEQAAKIEHQERRIHDLENQVAELRTAIARLQDDSPQRRRGAEG